VLRLDGDELFRCGETRRWLVVDSLTSLKS
jgi:hypothetical protein